MLIRATMWPGQNPVVSLATIFDIVGEFDFEPGVDYQGLVSLRTKMTPEHIHPVIVFDIFPITGRHGGEPKMWGPSMLGLDRYAKILSQLGKFTTGKSCLYIKKLADVDDSVLSELITESYAHMVKSQS